ncbi:MAG: hypothetical protein F4106_10910, partial [Gemmatimonadetes bacterium]|nr:hypothetical protein [Gemmatimonadota bacterium]
MRAPFSGWKEGGPRRAASAVARAGAAATLCACAMLASVRPAPAQAPRDQPPPDQPSEAQQPTYRVYVANESSDLVSRVAFTPGEGAVVEREIPVGIMPGDNDGAHGISVSPDGQYWYVTIAHGTPRGYLWKYHAGPDTLIARTRLGLFPATMGLTPDGQFLLAVNFNLHGDMVPSDVSVVYTPDMVEVTRIRTCMMPHGSRVRADGVKQYSACMHSERLVEIDIESFEVTRRFDVSPGTPDAVCSPTWVEPATREGADRFVYVACNRNHEVLEVDTELWEVSRRFATGQAPYNLEVTADGARLIATLKGEQAVAVFDLETGDELARIATSRPVTHGVVASPDGRYAFVSNESVGSVRGTLDVIDLAALEVVETVELQHQSGGIDFWSVTGADDRPGS